MVFAPKFWRKNDRASSRYYNAIKTVKYEYTMLTVGQNLAKFYQVGKILKVFAHLLFGHISNLLWKTSTAIGQIVVGKWTHIENIM